MYNATSHLTEEEVITFSDYFINNKVSLSPDGSGWLSQRELRIMGLESKTINYFLKKAIEDHKPPALIIYELVSEKISAVI